MEKSVAQIGETCASHCTSKKPSGDPPLSERADKATTVNIKHTSVMVAGKPSRGVNVTCKCGVVTTIPLNGFGQSVDEARVRDRMIGRKLEEKGWKTLKNKDGHSCPGCVSKHETKKSDGVLIVKDFKDMKTNVTTLPMRVSEEPPAKLERSDRRIINNKLEDVYIDEKTGYQPGWTDAKVAEDLGVPLAWVTLLRDEGFGPEGNEDLRAKLAEAEAGLAEIKTGIKDAQQIATLIPGIQRLVAALPDMQRVAASTPELQRRADKIEMTIIDVKKVLRA